MDHRRIEFKQVTADDYDKVMSIRDAEDIHGGHDYLPDLYKLMYNNMSTVGYAAAIDGELVAFQLVQLIDDGKAFITRCARVKKSWERRGIYRALDNYTKQIHQKNGARHVLTFDEGNLNLKSKLNTEEVRLITTRKYLDFWIDTDNINIDVMNTCHVDHNTKFMCPEDLKNIFLSKTLCFQLFPEDNLMCFYATLKPIESNIPFIFFERTKTVGTFEPECTLITFGTFHRCLIGFVYILDVYGKSTDKLKDHARLHFKWLMEQVGNEKISVCIVTENKENIHIDTLVKYNGFQNKDSCLTYHIERK